MNALDIVDPELKPMLAMAPRTPLSRDILPGLREALRTMVPPSPCPEGIEQQEYVVPGRPGLRLVIYRPAGGQALPLLFNIHGGGFIMGCTELNAARNRAIAFEVGCAVADLDYSHAPEHPFPSAIEDCYAALRWIRDEAKALAIDRERLAIGGDSAGGGLAASLALLARDRGEIRIVHQFLIYPMLDDRTEPAEGSPLGELIWTPRDNEFGWRALLGDAYRGEQVSPYAAAARAATLKGLPPAFIAVGSLDLFLEEDLAYGLRLAQAGISTELHVYPGAFHGFVFATDTAVAHACHLDLIGAIKRALG